MKPKRSQKTKAERDAKRQHAHEAIGGVVGALSGAGMGALVAGPAGAVAGAVIGAGMGASTSWAAEGNAAELVEMDHVLDAEIGVTEGSLGVPGLKHPPATRGAFSAAATGVGATTGETLAEGPILPPPD